MAGEDLAALGFPLVSAAVGTAEEQIDNCVVGEFFFPGGSRLMEVIKGKLPGIVHPAWGFLIQSLEGARAVAGLLGLCLENMSLSEGCQRTHTTSLLRKEQVSPGALLSMAEGRSTEYRQGA